MFSFPVVTTFKVDCFGSFEVCTAVSLGAENDMGSAVVPGPWITAPPSDQCTHRFQGIVTMETTLICCLSLIKSFERLKMNVIGRNQNVRGAFPRRAVPVSPSPEGARGQEGREDLRKVVAESGHVYAWEIIQVSRHLGTGCPGDKSSPVRIVWDSGGEAPTGRAGRRRAGRGCEPAGAQPRGWAQAAGSWLSRPARPFR